MGRGNDGISAHGGLMSSLQQKILALLGSMALVGLGLACEPDTEDVEYEREPSVEAEEESVEADEEQVRLDREEAEAETESFEEGEQAAQQQDEMREPARPQMDQEQLVRQDQRQMDQQDQQQMDQQQVDQQQVDQAAMQPPQKLQYYSDWAKNEKPGEAYPEYTSTGFVLLSSSFDMIAQQLRTQGQDPQQEQTGQQVDQQQDQQQQQQMAQQNLQKVEQMNQQLQQIAEQLGDNKNIYQHPQLVQTGARTVSNILQTMQQQPTFTDLKQPAQKLVDIAAKMDANKPLAAQKNSLQSFFSESGKAIDSIRQKMAVGGGPDGDQEHGHKEQDQPHSQHMQGQQQGMDQRSMQPQDKLKYFKQWTESEQPGQSFHGYSSNGFALLGNSFDILATQVQEQNEQQSNQQQPNQQQQAQVDQQQDSQKSVEQLQQHIQQLQEVARQLADNTDVYQHPQQFQKGAKTTVGILKAMQQQPQFSGLDSQVNQIDQMTQRIDSTKPLAAQKNSLDKFFTQTGDVIDKMSQKVAVGGGPTEGHQEQGQQKQGQQKQGQQAQNQESMQNEQKLRYHSQWAKNVKPGQVHNHYTSNGFALLSNSLDALSQQVHSHQDHDQRQQGQDQQGRQAPSQIDQQSIQQQSRNLQEVAKQLQDAPDMYQHPQHFQQGVQATVSVLKSMQQLPQFGEFASQVNQLEEFSQKIDTQKPLAAQNDSLQQFFTETSSVVNEMSQKVEQPAVGGGPAQGESQDQRQLQLEDQQDPNMQPSDEPSIQEQEDQPVQQQDRDDGAIQERDGIYDE